MKKLLYILFLGCSLTAVQSCKKDTVEPTPVVVGKWASDYLLTSGFVAPYASQNGVKLNPAIYGIQDTYDIKADKTFILTDRSSAVIQSLPGTWEYTGTELSLKYNDGSEDKLTYDATAASPQLAFPVVAVSDSLTNPTTKKPELVKFNLQLVYTKQ